MSTPVCIRRGLVALMLVAPFAAAAHEKPTVAIAREYIGDDCVAGTLNVEGDFVAFAIAVPHRKNKPRLATLIPGTFDAQLRGSAGKGWHITYTPISGQPAVKLPLGLPSAAGAGGIAIGDRPASDCHLSRPLEYANAARSFERHLQAFRSGADSPLAIRLKIEDR